MNYPSLINGAVAIPVPRIDGTIGSVEYWLDTTTYAQIDFGDILVACSTFVDRFYIGDEEEGNFFTKEDEARVFEQIERINELKLYNNDGEFKLTFINGKTLMFTTSEWLTIAQE